MENQVRYQRAEAPAAGDASLNRAQSDFTELLSKSTPPLEVARASAHEDRAVPQLSLAGADGTSINKEHRVKNGESLWKISEASLKEQKQSAQARDIQAMVEAIVKANRDKYPQLEKNPHKISRDMSLAIPNAKQEAKPNKLETKPEQPPGTERKAAPKIEVMPPVEGQQQSKFDLHQGPVRSIEKKAGQEAAKTDLQADEPVGGKEKPSSLKTRKPVNPEHPPSEKVPLPRPRPESADRIPLPRQKPESLEEKVPLPRPKPQQKAETEPPTQFRKKEEKEPVSHETFHGKNAVASWYNEGYKTANGEIFKPGGLTAAHKTMPFGTILEVFNPHSRKSVEVRINDRGPFKPERDIDLAEGAAREIGMLDGGVVPVKYRVVRWGK